VNEDKKPTWSIRDSLMAFGLVIVVSAIAASVLIVGFGEGASADDPDDILLGIVATAIGMVSGLVYARSKASSDAFALRPCTAEWAMYAVAMVVPVLGFGYCWASLLDWLGMGTEPQTYVDSILSTSDPVTLAISVAYGVIGAAVLEELLFRGIIQPPMVARWGIWVGILAQGCLFGMMHMVDLWAVFPTAVIGCVAGWLRFESGALGAPIIFHAVNNLLALLFNATMT